MQEWKNVIKENFDLEEILPAFKFLGTCDLTWRSQVSETVLETKKYPFAVLTFDGTIGTPHFCQFWVVGCL